MRDGWPQVSIGKRGRSRRAPDRSAPRSKGSGSAVTIVGSAVPLLRSVSLTHGIAAARDAHCDLVAARQIILMRVRTFGSITQSSGIRHHAMWPRSGCCRALAFLPESRAVRGRDPHRPNPPRSLTRARRPGAGYTERFAAKSQRAQRPARDRRDSERRCPLRRDSGVPTLDFSA